MKNNDERLALLRDAPPAEAVIRLGVPLILGLCIMVFYNLVDTYFIGLMKDDYQLAAVNFAYPVMMVSVAISIMMAASVSLLAWVIRREEKKGSL